MYADNMTGSMKYASEETYRRREIQIAYNDENGIIPTTIIKEVRPPIRNADDELSNILSLTKKGSRKEIENKIKELESQMRKAAKEFDFEKAAELRDIILEIKAELR
jgi:excinuclease ABC subunit B